MSSLASILAASEEKGAAIRAANMIDAELSVVFRAMSAGPSEADLWKKSAPGLQPSSKDIVRLATEAKQFWKSYSVLWAEFVPVFQPLCLPELTIRSSYDTAFCRDLLCEVSAFCEKPNHTHTGLRDQSREVRHRIESKWLKQAGSE